MNYDASIAGRLDTVIHAPTRLAIVTLLSQLEYAEFAFLKDSLATTDGNLGSHLRVLDQAGYVAVSKEPVGRRQRTTYTLTAAGRSALNQYLSMLSDVIRAARRKDEVS